MPYELLYKTQVDLSSFRVFCCLAFASTLPAKRTKFDPRARMCVFIGYPSRVKGYKLYDIVSKQIIFHSHDVVFHQFVFPFHSIVDNSDLIDPFPNLALPLAYSEASTMPNSSVLSSSSSSLNSHFFF